jgi:hypothetical protein
VPLQQALSLPEPDSAVNRLVVVTNEGGDESAMMVSCQRGLTRGGDAGQPGNKWTSPRFSGRSTGRPGWRRYRCAKGLDADHTIGWRCEGVDQHDRSLRVELLRGEQSGGRAV